MTSATTQRFSAMWDELETLVDALSHRASERIARESAVYRELPPTVLFQALRANIEHAITVFREQTLPTAGELERFASAAVDRALQGFPLQDVLRAYRIGVAEMWGEVPGLVARHALQVDDVLGIASTMMRWDDAVADAVAGAHARVGLQLAREDQQRRDTFLRAILTGTLQGEDLRRASSGFGLDLEQPYVPSRIRPAAGRWPHGLTDRLVLDLSGRPGVVGQLDGDAVVVAALPPEPLPDVTIAIGPPSVLAELPAAFGVATRALQTACAFGLSGLVELGSLSIRPAVLSESALGELFEARRLAPLDDLGHLGTELALTLRTWLELGMRHEETARVLHLHPNTLRHRLRRYEQLTGASLRDVTTITELWWGLERRSMR